MIKWLVRHQRSGRSKQMEPQSKGQQGGPRSCFLTHSLPVCLFLSLISHHLASMYVSQSSLICQTFKTLRFLLSAVRQHHIKVTLLHLDPLLPPSHPGYMAPSSELQQNCDSTIIEPDLQPLLQHWRIIWISTTPWTDATIGSDVEDDSRFFRSSCLQNCDVLTRWASLSSVPADWNTNISDQYYLELEYTVFISIRIVYVYCSFY